MKLILTGLTAMRELASTFYAKSITEQIDYLFQLIMLFHFERHNLLYDITLLLTNIKRSSHFEGVL
jgi:hypothetical protein